MSIQYLESTQPTDELRLERILNRFDSVTAKMAKEDSDISATEIAQLRRLIEDHLTHGTVTDDVATDEQVGSQKLSIEENSTLSESHNNSFLLSITGLGSSAEGNLSEQDEEILSAEVHPIYGWTSKLPPEKKG